LCGLLIWREYRGSDLRVKVTAALVLLIFAGGVTAISLATYYTRT